MEKGKKEMEKRLGERQAKIGFAGEVIYGKRQAEILQVRKM